MCGNEQRTCLNTGRVGTMYHPNIVLSQFPLREYQVYPGSKSGGRRMDVQQVARYHQPYISGIS